MGNMCASEKSAAVKDSKSQELTVVFVLGARSFCFFAVAPLRWSRRGATRARGGVWSRGNARVWERL